MSGWHCIEVGFYRQPRRGALRDPGLQEWQGVCALGICCFRDLYGQNGHLPARLFIQAARQTHFVRAVEGDMGAHPGMV